MRVRPLTAALCALSVAVPVSLAAGGTGAAAAGCDPFTTTPSYDAGGADAQAVLGFDLGRARGHDGRVRPLPAAPSTAPATAS